VSIPRAALALGGRTRGGPGSSTTPSAPARPEKGRNRADRDGGRDHAERPPDGISTWSWIRIFAPTKPSRNTSETFRKRSISGAIAK
jgi:hypothetical protein